MYSLDGFTWQRGETLASNPEVLAAGIAVYLGIVLVLPKLLQGKAVPPPTFLAATHNLVLCLGSAVMFVGCAYEAVKEIVRSRDSTWLFCLPLDTKVEGPLWFWSYVYYLSKYYELLDTVILILKCRPLSFLHVFHHSVVLAMAYFWLDSAQSLQVMGLLFNTGVHVVMYYYYFLCTVKRAPKWKRMITNLQIVQFCFSFLASLPFWWMHFRVRPCSGFRATVFNAVFNFALLGLFVNFHRSSYKAKAVKSA